MKGAGLVPEFVSGEGFRTLSALAIPLGQGVSGWVAENKKPILNGNPAMAMEGTAGGQQQIASLHAALAVPLEAVDGVVGVLTLYQTEEDAFSKEHLRLVLALSSKVALAIENALKFREAQSSAKTDYLTGLPNARSLFVQLDSELARAQRDGASVAVLVADLDGCKQVNDRFGHLTGNRVLQEVAGRLRNCCREYDYIARMGGDEFVMVLPGATGQNAAAKEAQLCRAATEAGLAIGHVSTLSLSVGIAMYPQDGMDAESLLAAADRRMYKVKQAQKSERRVVDLHSITVPTNVVLQ